MKAAYSIVAMKYCSAEDFVKSLRAGEPLTLIREPTNPADRNAVQVWAQERRIGYVKGTQAAGLARAMDESGHTSINGKLAFGGDRWPMAEVEE